MRPAIVFDLDDTLYPERDYVYSGFAAVAAACGDAFPGVNDLALLLRERFDADSKARVFNDVVATYAPDGGDVLVQRMVAVYRAHEPKIQLYDDASACLDACAKIGRLGLISDGRLDGQQAKVRALGLAEHIACIVLTGVWGEAYWKPHARAYEHIEAAFGVRGDQCVYIADNPRKDFVSPNRMGWRTVRVQRADALTLDRETAPGGDPEYTITSLADLPALLQSWFA